MPLRGPVSTSPDAATAVDGAQAPPRAPAAGAPAGAIIALSDDPLLLDALTGAALADSAVITSPSTDRFIDQLVANAPGIALIDASSVATPLKGFIATLREQFPQLLLILTGPAQLQAQLSAQIDDGTIFRFVHKPASSQRLKLFIDSALRQQALPELPIERPMAGAALRAAAPEPPAGRRGGLALAGLSGAALAAGAIAWAVWHEGSPPTPSKPAPADSAATATHGPSPQRSEVANPEATERDQPAGDAQVARDAAARDAAARDAAALEQAQRSALSARAEQLSVYLQLARKRLGSGALIEPADDSARAYLASALALAPEDAEVRATSMALGEALIAQFRHALAAGDRAQAQRRRSAQRAGREQCPIQILTGRRRANANPGERTARRGTRRRAGQRKQPDASAPRTTGIPGRRARARYQRLGRSRVHRHRRWQGGGYRGAERRAKWRVRTRRARGARTQSLPPGAARRCAGGAAHSNARAFSAMKPCILLVIEERELRDWLRHHLDILWPDATVENLLPAQFQARVAQLRAHELDLIVLSALCGDALADPGDGLDMLRMAQASKDCPPIVVIEKVAT